MAILSKKQMSEEDIKLNFITPAIQPAWQGHITMETKITDGRINIRGNLVARSTPKFADYILYLNDGKPIAVVEAKDNNHSVSHGLQQAMTYAQMMDLPFAYSSNGDAFYEHDFLTGTETLIELDKFPSQEELIARYYTELNGGSGITDEEKKIVSQPYYSSQSTYPPRYYQRNAVNRTVEAIARGQERLLLVMATGTGKTYTAFQIVYRLLRSGIKNRILYLADRNILVDQSILQDFAPLEKTIYKVDFSDKECLKNISSHEVNFALYHQMVGQNDEEHAPQLSERTSSGSLRKPAHKRNAASAPCRDRPSLQRAYGNHRSCNGEAGRRDRDAQSHRPDGMGAPHDQHPQPCGGNRSDRACI